MKTTIAFVLGLLLAFATTSTQAQTGTDKTISIQTSTVCEMCKATIEKALAFEKGVKTADVDWAAKIVTVTYNTKRTTDAKIRKAISKAGYKADDIAADPKAFAKLPDCCKAECDHDKQ